ncbi:MULTISPECIES: nickel/cobalt efflux transporter [Achromobacter]|uniref:nickel/cobalt efflux transporter n=1 Tax=Achromobacter TaxID=222 RepID=UPI002FE0477B
MLSFSDLLAQGAAHAWLFIPSAILLGALHGLEPGHSKTMMAAFIVAIRGTVGQAMLLGITATISHTLIVWGIGLGGLYLWQGVDAEHLEPYFQFASGGIIVLIAAWMFWRTWREQHPNGAHDHDHDHNHRHAHGTHAHGEEWREIDTGHGVVMLEIFEDGVPPRWRLRVVSGQAWRAADVNVSTERPDGAMQSFTFADRGGYLESVDEIPEPHEFMARLTLAHGHHAHSYDVAFIEEDAHQHDHIHEELRGLNVSGEGFQDAHQLAHANDIRRRFADRKVTNWQIALFGLTGGLIPCPAAITVLLLCLQLKEFTLGAVLVLCFSIGLAITLVTVGAVAALSVRHATKRFSWFSTIARRAPYFSSLLIIAVGVYVGLTGWLGMQALQAG